MLTFPHFSRTQTTRIIVRCIFGLLMSLSATLQADEGAALGKTWTIRQAPSGLREVVYGAGKFIAFGAGRLATSPDGFTWTEKTPPSENSWIASVFAQGRFVALSSADSEQFPTNVMTSSNGLSWALANDGLLPGSQWRSIAYGNGTFVAGSSGTFSMTFMAASPDAVTWTPIAPPVGSAGIVQLAFGNNTFVAVQSSNGLSGVRSLLRSTNGIDWQEQALPSGASSELFGVTFGRGQFVAVGDNQTIITSSDGITWTTRSGSGGNTLVEVIDAGDRYITFGYESSSNTGVILTSPDGITWRQQSSPSSLSRISAAYAHGVVVALSAVESSSETVITSGTYKISHDLVFPAKSAKLTQEAKQALTSALSELDTTRRVRLTVRTQSTKAPREALLARRRLLTVSRYVRSQRNSQLRVRATVKFSSRVRTTARDRVSSVFVYG